jgi:hypothetical protein
MKKKSLVALILSAGSYFAYALVDYNKKRVYKDIKYHAIKSKIAKSYTINNHLKECIHLTIKMNHDLDNLNQYYLEIKNNSSINVFLKNKYRIEVFSNRVWHELIFIDDNYIFSDNISSIGKNHIYKIELLDYYFLQLQDGHYRLRFDVEIKNKNFKTKDVFTSYEMVYPFYIIDHKPKN